MKTPFLFCSFLAFITSCVFTWKAESSLGETMGYIALAVSLITIGKIIIGKLNT